MLTLDLVIVNKLNPHTPNHILTTFADHILAISTSSLLPIGSLELSDHHKDDWAGRTPIKKTIELVGSCATLIAERILNVAPTSLDTQVTMLLLATISLDCINLDPRAGRATEKDRAVLDRLQKHGSCGESRDELYKSVSQGKEIHMSHCTVKH